MNKSKKIFIADDDPDILQIISLMLHTKQYEVETSSDANVIFNKREQMPDLILLDIWMSGIDGRDICNKLKEDIRTKDIPVIFISANSNIEAIAAEYKADGFVAKPFEMDFFLNKINYFLETADKNHQLSY